MLPFNHRELIHHLPIVRVGIRPIYKPYLIVNCASVLLVFHRHTIHEHLVESAVVRNQ